VEHQSWRGGSGRHWFWRCARGLSLVDLLLVAARVPWLEVQALPWEVQALPWEVQGRHWEVQGLHWEVRVPQTSP